MAFELEQARGIAAAYTAAWNTGEPAAVASFYALDGTIIINAGDPWRGREGVAAMAAGFFADIPDLTLTCDGVRVSGDHMIYLWTFAGSHAVTGNALSVAGWEEWDLDSSGLVKLSRGWFDSGDYAGQIGPVLRSGS